MKQKLITFLVFIFFISGFSYLYGDEYKEFYEQKIEVSESKEILERGVESFSLDSLSQVQEVDFFITPDMEVLDMIVEKINVAQERVYLEVYIFTEKRMLEAMKQAHKRGVEVQVILERNPYMAPKLNLPRFAELEKLGISVVWSNTQNYALNHSKFFIIDDEVILSTGNMSYSSFSKNRDFIVSVKDKKVLQDFLDIFRSDFLGIPKTPYSENLVISPEYSRSKISELFFWAEKSIDMYFQYLQDDELFQILLDRAKENIDIKIVLDDDFYEENPDEIQILRDAGIQVQKYKSSVMHAKAILVDDTYLFIGSINFSSYSLDKNRETGIILSDKKTIKEFQKVFSDDFWL